MIYCFSGTGNSLLVANWIAAHLNEKICLLPTLPLIANNVSQEKYIGFIFPTYAWGTPKVVKDFLHRLPHLKKQPLTFAIFTCGDDIGMADRVLQKLLYKRGWKLDEAFSVTMRETYVCLPGFNTDSLNIENLKHQNAQQRIADIADYIKSLHLNTPNTSSTKSLFYTKKLTRGSFPRIKSYVIRPFFNRFLMNDKHFYATPSTCNHCGKCAKICPLHNINIENNLPHWNGHCTHCLRCYHACPKHAIEYGFFTKGKGQVKINF